MADKGTDKSAAFSPAFATLFNRANSAPPTKPNFGKKDQAPLKPNFGLSSKLTSQTKNSDTPVQCSTPRQTPPEPDSPQPKIAPTTPFANLINKSKDSKPANGSSSLETLSAKYLNSSHVAPKFGSSGSPADITCPVFKRSVSSPADQSHDIRPLLQQSGLPTSPEIQIPRPDPGPGIVQDMNSDYGSPSPKYTFSPLPNKAQSPGNSFSLSGSPDSKQSSLGKLKDRYMKNSRVGPSCDGGSPCSPSLDDNKAKGFKFDLSSALVARKQNVNIASPGILHTNVSLTPKRRTYDHTIVVDQLTCVLDARSLLDEPRQQTTTRRKRMSKMGKVICKRWKTGSCENIPVCFPVHCHIPVFKFDTMSPDDEIESRFKRRR
uniref:Uncharacterized protein n=1 Tax=Cacopsylla melanoneura TaxID=428564 RepID=A0A8D8RDW2_9HEMI